MNGNSRPPSQGAGSKTKGQKRPSGEAGGGHKRVRLHLSGYATQRKASSEASAGGGGGVVAGQKYTGPILYDMAGNVVGNNLSAATGSPVYAQASTAAWTDGAGVAAGDATYDAASAGGSRTVPAAAAPTYGVVNSNAGDGSTLYSDGAVNTAQVYDKAASGGSMPSSLHGEQMYTLAGSSAAAGTAPLPAKAKEWLPEWLQLAKMPTADTGLTREGASRMLMASASGPGTFCFRPSSKDPNTVVLCVLIDNENVANLRMKTADTGQVAVYDLTAKPVEFKDFDSALAHFADPNATPNNSVPISECMSLDRNQVKLLREQMRTRGASLSITRPSQPGDSGA